ncbi:MAG: septal ring lytic transglycosylase RlpA family protein [bacterium]|nr:septal ring lytic transglycosylase RlpA family protein [bacterium]
MWWGGAAGLLVAVLVASGCSLGGRATPPPVIGGTQEGVASWYGPGFHGKRTANGEIYDQHDMTAAHPSLPLGTRVLVTNLSNGRAVEVRINDRGPFVGRRVIDLSYAAARSIDMIGPGTARVRIGVITNDTDTRLAAATPAAGIVPAAARPRTVPPAAQVPSELPRAAFVVQVATFSDPNSAEHLRRTIALRFPDAYVDPLDTADGRYHRVRIGPYPLRRVAVARAELINRLGWPAIIMEHPGP